MSSVPDASQLSPSLSPPFATRTLAGTGIGVHPLAIDGSVFGWAAGDGETSGVLDSFRAHGGNLISTADHYAGGRSELMIGSWLRTAGDRSSLVIATKIGKHPDYPGLAEASILRAVEASLARLRTDYIDVLSFDRSGREVVVDEALTAVDRLVREGKVRFLSSSGYTAEWLDEADLIASAGGHTPFSAMVVDYNLMQRDEFESGLQRRSVAAGRSALVRNPLASGFLTGRLRSRDDVAPSIVYDKASHYLGRRGTRVLQALDSIARELDETVERVALAWVLVKPGVASVLYRAQSEEDIEGIFSPAGVALGRHHLAELDRASAS